MSYIDSAWIAPDGKVTDVTMGSTHSQTARDVLGDSTGGRHLERDGYIHLSYGWCDLYDHEPTQAQIDALGDILKGLQEANQLFIAAKVSRFIADPVEAQR